MGMKREHCDDNNDDEDMDCETDSKVFVVGCSSCWYSMVHFEGHINEMSHFLIFTKLQWS